MKELDAMPTEESSELTLEKIQQMKSLEVEIKTDLGQTLEELKQQTGINFAPREDGFHLTIIGPAESKVLATLTEEQLAELNEINKQILNGEGITIQGIGVIDGAGEEFKMREVDTVKKTSFVALDIPALQEFRAKIGLPSRYFHITLGFVGGDIHTEVIGQEPLKPNSPKMKDITRPIPKVANEKFSSITLPEIQFGGISE
ncbi:MAG: hypothetical protein V4690_02985 [Patescibacteria group bacterium]